ncbi:LysR substrate-binding domain-containing protein [Janthinobacterium fluminis]|uniref:LysR substrate-binding domain-containing protein n=1 Tax=Janthinobacterium fluminis TaxID=2987524 RepID=A0ABT5K3J2_9BURK|nr:LysR substrate-binding domain-containing protein [Janthinobacterium fluminis]MDC8759542.1 LysR substrate-binding domain-containing protein [Janthinobacterium fluminis]
MNNLRAVDLNLLVILEALLSERHLSRAAARLHMSQPAVSHALGRLRALLDDPLLVRGRGGFQPTARALELSRPLADALQHVRSVLGGAVFDAATARRTFRLAMSDYGAAIVLPGLMRRLRAEAPGIDLSVVYASRESMAAGVVDGDIDLALGVFPHTPETLRRETLLEERFVCALDAATLPDGAALTLDAYLARPHVLVASGDRAMATEVDTELARHGWTRRIALRLPHWAVAPAVLAGTDLVLTVARRALRGGAAGLALVEPPFAIAPFVFEQIWHSRAEGDAGLSWLRVALRGAALERDAVTSGGAGG